MHTSTTILHTRAAVEVGSTRPRILREKKWGEDPNPDSFSTSIVICYSFADRASKAALAVVASFSTWGPNPIARGLMKVRPDVSAPGIDILAAYPPTVPVMKVPGDERRSPRYGSLLK
ncbi:hypothetical protein CRG98_046894 [Punica granatum]|uniref:Uncharacterized protein n=1 Tax=Punica granatum TaxID=22663 RepID=A0A2I0HMM8_PUNGR|nr:hypothetical protein CRG98_046894 [Punica granatum]